MVLNNVYETFIENIDVLAEPFDAARDYFKYNIQTNLVMEAPSDGRPTAFGIIKTNENFCLCRNI